MLDHLKATKGMDDCTSKHNRRTSAVLSLRPLELVDLAIVYYNEGMLLRKDEIHHLYWVCLTVIATYEQGGGKTARHAWVSDCNSIGKFSYVVVQLYEHLGNGCLLTNLEKRALYSRGLAHLPSSHFLCCCPARPKSMDSGHSQVHITILCWRPGKTSGILYSQ